MTSTDLFRLTLKAAAFASLGFVAFVTMSPIELRPVVAGLQFEHVAAFLVIGLLFGLAYPRHFLMIGVLLALTAIALEVGQQFVPGRHGKVIDVVFKLVGGGGGLATAWVALHWLRTKALLR